MAAMAREIPFDRPIRFVLSIGHIFAFSIYYGSMIVGSELDIAKIIAIATGVLLAGREIYKDGWKWLTRTDGACTVLKVILILTDDIVPSWKLVMLSGVVLLGTLSSQLPDSARKKYWL